jgi:hypothetical protein
VFKKALEFWNLFVTQNPDVVIKEELCLKEDMNNSEALRTYFTIFSRDKFECGGGVFISVNNFTTITELLLDDNFEMIAIELKGLQKNNF